MTGYDLFAIGLILISGAAGWVRGGARELVTLLAFALAAFIAECQQLGTSEEAIERVRALEPGVVVMDLDMPGMGGLEATRQIQALELGTKLLVLTSHSEAEYLLPVLEAGGSGYVQKTKADEDLIAAIRVVARDEVFLYPSATKLLLKGYRMAEESGEANPLEELSEREREVLALTAEGYDQLMLTSVVKQIGEAVHTTIEETLEGGFTNEPYIGTLENEGVGLAPFHDFDSEVPQELKDQIEEYTQQIISGELVVETPNAP